MYVLVREGGIRKEIEAVAKIKDMNLDLRQLILTTDGIMPEQLLAAGYLEVVVQKAIDLGFEPISAIQMVTINAARHLNLDHIIGGIAPGKYADIVIIPDLYNIKAEYVISNGRTVARDGEVTLPPRKHTFPEWTRRSMRLSKQFEPLCGLLMSRGISDT